MDKGLILIRGGGDLASGVALRLYRAGLRVVITELTQPLAVRRGVSFSEAVYEGNHIVEGVTARLVKPDQLSASLDAKEIPVLIDPDANILLSSFFFPVIVDARLLKQTPTPLPIQIPLHIGLGPGFHAGRDCHAVIETRRSHTLGRVIWNGETQPDSRQPEGDPRRVLRAPVGGVIFSKAKIGDHIEEGQVIAEIWESGFGDRELENRKSKIVNPLKGVLRGIIRDGLHVPKGIKIGDIDPRDDVNACFLVSDKALAIGGGVLEAILSREEIRNELW